jgi:hypothetical protein
MILTRGCRTPDDTVLGVRPMPERALRTSRLGATIRTIEVSIEHPEEQ